MNDVALEFSEYAIKYSKNAIQLRKKLPDNLRAILNEIVEGLADDPNKYQQHTITLSDNMFIYRHPEPSLEVTYKLDHDEKIIYFLHLVAPTLKVSKSIFISYSHEDEKWLLELKKWLKPLEQRDIISIWDDKKLKPGNEWLGEIEKALASANAAILLISQDFLNSKFIANNELPTLLDAAKVKGLSILWIAVKQSTVKDSEISKYQAVHEKPPLDSLNPAKRDEKYLRIYERIKEVVES